MPYTDDEIRDYAHKLEQKGAPPSDIEGFIKAAKQEQMQSPQSQQPTMDNPIQDSAELWKKDTEASRQGRPWENLPAFDPYESIVKPIGESGMQEAEAYGLTPDQPLENKIANIAAYPFHKVYDVGANIIGGFGNLIQGTLNLAYHGTGLSQINPLDDRTAEQKSLAGIGALNQTVSGAGQIFSSPFSLVPGKKNLLTLPFEGLAKITENVVKSAGIDPQSDYGTQIIQSVNNAAGLAPIAIAGVRGMDKPATPGEIQMSKTMGDFAGKLKNPFSKGPKELPPDIAPGSPGAQNWHWEQANAFDKQASNIAYQILQPKNKVLAEALKNGEELHAADSFKQLFQKRLESGAEPIKEYGQLNDIYRTEKATVQKQLDAEIAPVAKNTYRESDSYPGRPEYTDQLSKYVDELAKDPQQKAAYEAAKEYLDNEVKFAEINKPTVGQIQGRKIGLNTELAPRYNMQAVGNPKAFMGETKAMQLIRNGLADEVEYHAGPKVGELNKYQGGLIEGHDMIADLHAKGVKAIDPTPLQKFANAWKTYKTGMSSFPSIAAKLENVLKTKTGQIAKNLETSSVMAGKNGLPRMFNSIIDTVHDIVAENMPEKLANELIDINGFERTLKTNQLSKIMNEKVDIPKYNADFNKQFITLKNGIIKRAQGGKISVMDLHDLVRDFQKTTAKQMESQYIPEVKSSIVNYLLGEADRQTNGFVSQVYQSAYQKYFAEAGKTPLLPAPTSNAQGQTINLPSRSETTIAEQEAARVQNPDNQPQSNFEAQDAAMRSGQEYDIAHPKKVDKRSWLNLQNRMIINPT